MEYLNNTCVYLKNMPIHLKIMNFMLFKNIGIGFYIGIKNFKSSSKPVSQLFDSIISYTIWGFFEAFCWPISLSYMLTVELDKVALYLMDKKKD